MAKTKQTAGKSTGGSGKAKQKADRVFQRKTAPRSQMSLAIQQANQLLVDADASDRRPRVSTNTDPRVSKSGKSCEYKVTFNGLEVIKVVPAAAPVEKTRLDTFTKNDLRKPVDERLRLVRMVKLIDDERGALVEWMDGVEMWVPLVSLAEHGSTATPWLECTRAFMASQETELLKFLESHPWGRDYDGASEDGLCGFHAVRAAVGFLGLEVSERAVQAYVADAQEGRGIDLTDGTNFDELKRFVKAQKLAVDVAGMEKNWFDGSGTGVAGVVGALKEDGVYLVAGRVGVTIWRHVVAAWKCGGTILVLDGEQTAHIADLDWLTDISYIRKMQLA